MRLRLIAGAILLCLGALAQTAMTVDKLVEFMRSSIRQKDPDVKVAGYVKGIRLTQKLDDRVIEQLQGEGLGPRTVAALRSLGAASASLPAAEAKTAAPPPAAAPEEPPPSNEQQAKILEAAREYALHYSESLPNFICAQSTRRYAGDRMYDHVLAKLTFYEQREKYDTIAVNDKVTNTPYEKLGGSISTGEFGSMLRGIFDRETQAQFAWSAWRSLRGHKAFVFKFSVDQANSRWQIEDRESSQKISPAYAGFVWIDVKDNSVLAFTMKAVNMPVTFPITAADSRMDYDNVDISGVAHVLPSKAVMHMFSGRGEQRNEITFHNYHQYTTDTSLKFEEPPPDEKPKQ